MGRRGASAARAAPLLLHTGGTHDEPVMRDLEQKGVARHL